MPKCASLRLPLLLVDSALLAADLPQIFLAFFRFFLSTRIVLTPFSCLLACVVVARTETIAQRSTKLSVTSNATT